MIDWLPKLESENPWYVLIRLKFDELVAGGMEKGPAFVAATRYGYEVLQEHHADLDEMRR